MKSYVRKHNTSFRLTDVQRLASEWIGALDFATAKSYIADAHQNELVFRRGDAYAEHIEKSLIDDDNDDSDTVNDMHEESGSESDNEPWDTMNDEIDDVTNEGSDNATDDTSSDEMNDPTDDEVDDIDN
jgi:hypothetical protein